MSGNERRTRVVIGALCGLATGIAISALMLVEDPATVSLLPIGSRGVHVVGHLGVAAALRTVFGWISPRSERAHAALTNSGLILGLLWWIVGPLTMIPLVRGRRSSARSRLRTRRSQPRNRSARCRRGTRRWNRAGDHSRR